MVLQVFAYLSTQRYKELRWKKRKDYRERVHGRNVLQPHARKRESAFHLFQAKCKRLSKIYPMGFPGGAVVESLPANAGDTGSSPGLGRYHMPRSSWAHEPQLLSLCVWSLCSATREAATVTGPRTAMKSGPRLPQLEKALAQKRRPNTAKTK